MNLQAFENLELIPELLNEIKIMSERMEKFAPPITTKREVARFLNKSESWVNNKMAEGLLVEGYHFHRKNAKMLVFIEEAVLEFRDKLHRGVANEKVTF